MADETTKSAAVGAANHFASFAAGYILSRLLKHGLVTSEESAVIFGFLPSLLYSIGYSIYSRIKSWRRVRIANALPANTPDAQIVAVEKQVSEELKKPEVATLDDALTSLRENGGLSKVE